MSDVAGWAFSQEGLGRILAGRGGALRRTGLVMSSSSLVWVSTASMAKLWMSGVSSESLARRASSRGFDFVTTILFKFGAGAAEEACLVPRDLFGNTRVATALLIMLVLRYQFEKVLFFKEEQIFLI